MLRQSRRSGLAVLAGGLWTLLVGGAADAAQWTPQLVHVFCTRAPCADGEEPAGGVIADAAGNLYGVTYAGGARGGGTVYVITPDGQESVRYNFCSAGNCADGKSPIGELVADPDGNLYGVTVNGGDADHGTVFQVTPDGQETVIYSFCGADSCADGDTPSGGLTADGSGNLYGTTRVGGANASGTVFQITPTGQETVLHSFCSAVNCADGAYPADGLAADKSGNLYGVTGSGGDSGHGAVFQLTPDGTLRVLHSFSQFGPAGGVVIDKKGDLYGTTRGAIFENYQCPAGGGCGTVFEITRDGAERVVHDFCPAGPCYVAYQPSGLTLDRKGNLFGTTVSGVFEITAAGKEMDLARFCSTGPQCLAGGSPSGRLLLDGRATLYGTTALSSSATIGGTVFDLSR